jgi:hypothetical protein
LMEGRVESVDDERVIFSGLVRVGDDVILTANEIMCALIAVEQLDDPDSVRERADVALHGRARR